MVLTTDNCCRCIPIKEGTILLGFTSLVLSLFSLSYYGEAVTEGGTTRRRDFFRELPNCNMDCQNDMLYWTTASIIPSLLSAGLHFLSAIALVAGVTVFNEYAGLLILYPCWLLLSILLDLTSWVLMVYAVLVVVRKDYAKMVVGIVTGWLLVSFLKLHFFAVVTSYRRRVVLKQKNDRVPSSSVTTQALLTIQGQPQAPPTCREPTTQPLSAHAAVQVSAPNTVSYIYIPQPPEDHDPPPPYEALFKPHQ